MRHVEIGQAKRRLWSECRSTLYGGVESITRSSVTASTVLFKTWTVTCILIDSVSAQYVAHRVINMQFRIYRMCWQVIDASVRLVSSGNSKCHTNWEKSMSTKKQPEAIYGSRNKTKWFLKCTESEHLLNVWTKPSSSRNNTHCTKT